MTIYTGRTSDLRLEGLGCLGFDAGFSRGDGAN